VSMSKFKVMLESLLNGATTHIASNHKIFNATRRGIYEFDYILYWADAERILKQLNEMES
jgi:hypothetical protein